MTRKIGEENRKNRCYKCEDYDYDMVMVYCPRCHSKFIDVIQPYLWKHGDKHQQIFICLFCRAKLLLW